MSDEQNTNVANSSAADKLNLILRQQQIALGIAKQTVAAIYEAPNSQELQGRCRAAMTEALKIVAPEGEMRMVAIATLASLIATVAHSFTRTDREDQGVALPTSIFVAAIATLADEFIAVHHRDKQTADDMLDAAIPADPAHAH